MLASRPASERGGEGDRAFLAFKLHRFISGAGHVYATLRGSGQRRITLDGQRFDPDDKEARLYATFYCRNCGQEHHPVVLAVEDGAYRVLPRDIDETPLDDPDSAERSGYLMPEPENDSEFTFKGDLEDFPEDWLELDRGGSPRLRRERKAYVPCVQLVPDTTVRERESMIEPGMRVRLWHVPCCYRRRESAHGRRSLRW